MVKIAIFTSAKPFTSSPHIAVIQNNALGSWASLGDDVEVFLIGEEEGAEEAAESLGIVYIKDVARNTHGTPYIPALFNVVRSVCNCELMAFINADVIALSDMVDVSQRIAMEEKNFLLVGQRYDIAIDEPVSFSDDWQKKLFEKNQREGKLHGNAGSDYFIFPRHCFIEVPDLVIGRAGWDNWMIFEARHRGWKTIDCTGAITMLHQNHDYSHLPGGQVHYHLPESNDNVKAAGGFLTVFTLDDADHFYDGIGIRKKKITWKRFWREVEIMPVVRRGDHQMGKIFHYLLHPNKGWIALKGWMRRKFCKEA